MRNRLLPDKAINELKQMLEDIDERQWAIGDYILELGAELVPQQITWKGLYAQLADGTGAAPDTLRDITHISRNVPQHFRDLYPALSRWQWRALIPAPPEHFARLAKLAVESADEYNGKPAPVRVIRAWVQSLNNGPGLGSGPPSPSTYGQHWNWAITHESRFEAMLDGAEDETLREALQVILDWMEAYKEWQEEVDDGG